MLPVIGDQWQLYGGEGA